MKQRSRLKAAIVEAWRSCIAVDYCRQRINSERSLQASFWSRLNERLPANRRMFIEPRLVVPAATGDAVLLPDLVICNSRHVIGVIELKYQPRARPVPTKDIHSLAALAGCRAAIAITNCRYRGESADDAEYGLAEHVLFVWAGVHAAIPATGKESPLFSTGKPSLKGCYLELHAATRTGARPEVYARAG